ncbi:MAG: hypothetical protein IK104_04875 [Clostridia bacterium]|nr:hypothetical protein [Clostridia bacterium]
MRAQPEREVFSLLSDWGEGMLRLQIDAPADQTRRGALLCPACGRIHGRCHEAVYPLLCLAERTGEGRYLSAAKNLFDWGENMLCEDGAVKNDFESGWKGVTAFAAIALHDALKYHGSLLSAPERAAWEARLRGYGEWVYLNLTPERTPAYLNYYAAAAAATALLGTYFGRDDYISRARELAVYCLSHVSGNGLLYGEGRPNDAVTPKGCRPFDLGGYNVEESLPCLFRCAVALGDETALKAVKNLFRAHLLWMLPDGGWDDSVGTRAFKWTYWGSRTADGCQEALFALGKTDPVFAEAALRNLSLLRRCTQNGFLAGGPDYARHGETPCVHHTFCHAKALAGALNAGIPAVPRVPLPADAPAPLVFYPELDAVRASCGGWRMDVTGYDFSYMKGDHASGGAVSLLWHEKAGPLIAVGAVDEPSREPLNLQKSTHPEDCRCTCPRIEITLDGVRYGSLYDFGAALAASSAPDRVTADIRAFLCDAGHRRMPGDGVCTMCYSLTPSMLEITGSVPPAQAGDARFFLPLIGEKAAIEVRQGILTGPPKPFFNLNPGFVGFEYAIAPDERGVFRLCITVK